jgi:O-acetyl-ADP-ribose deacetylase (regulator of RNase III)
VGSAFIVPTSDQRIPLLIHAPTMRMPHDISGTDAVYRATYAAFLATYMHNTKSERKIQTLAFAAMGTGFGGMSFDESARQMATAYDHYLHPPHRLDWDTAILRQNAINPRNKTKGLRCD